MCSGLFVQVRGVRVHLLPNEEAGDKSSFDNRRGILCQSAISPQWSPMPSCPGQQMVLKNDSPFFFLTYSTVFPPQSPAEGRLRRSRCGGRSGLVTHYAHFITFVYASFPLRTIRVLILAFEHLGRSCSCGCTEHQTDDRYTFLSVTHHKSSVRKHRRAAQGVITFPPQRKPPEHGLPPALFCLHSLLRTHRHRYRLP